MCCFVLENRSVHIFLTIWCNYVVVVDAVVIVTIEIVIIIYGNWFWWNVVADVIAVSIESVGRCRTIVIVWLIGGRWWASVWIVIIIVIVVVIRIIIVRNVAFAFIASMVQLGSFNIIWGTNELWRWRFNYVRIHNCWQDNVSCTSRR